MIVVTGGAGFIGSNIVKSLNQQGRTDILVVDDFTNVDKVNNLSDCVIADYMDKSEFMRLVTSTLHSYQLNQFQYTRLSQVEVIFHQGACSDTMATDGQYVLKNNYEYSKTVLDYCQFKRIPMIYASSASVYGSGERFAESQENEQPLNAYAYSKLLFDQHVRSRIHDLSAPVIGFRYFNVYGYREQHKLKMSSVAFHFSQQYRNDKKVKLFKGINDYENGQQQRDFVFIEDVVAINMHFWQYPVTGIYNLGTGVTATFNDVALGVVNHYRQDEGEPTLSIEEMVDEGIIEYIDFPKALLGKYQNYTCADLSSLRQAGCHHEFQSVENAIPKYVRWLEEHVFHSAKS